MYRLGLLVGIAAFVVVSFWQSFQSLFALWQQTDHRHGALVFPIAAFLIWRLRPAIEKISIKSEPTGLILVVALLMTWLGARLAGIQVIEHISVLAMIPATVYTITGRETASKILFPLLFLLLSTPIGDALVPHLMLVTADMSTALLRISGIPVLRDGQYISLPGGNFVVADVCSGVRYLTSGFMIALLYSHLSYQSLRKWIVFTAVTLLVLVLTNGVRAYIVMAVASATELRYFGGRDHIYFGWILFGIVTMLLMWFGGRFADRHVHLGSQESDDKDEFISPSARLIVVLGLIMLATTTNPLQADLGDTSRYLVLVTIVIGAVLLAGHGRRSNPILESTQSSASVSGGWRSPVTTVATILILAVVPQASFTSQHTAGLPVDSPDLAALRGCETPEPWRNRWLPQMHAPDMEMSATMSCAGQAVSVYVAGYAASMQGKELISGSNRLTPEIWDRYATASAVRFSDDDGESREVVEIYVNRPGYEGLVWYWYDIDGRWTTGELSTKVLQMLAMIGKNPSGGRVFLLETKILDSRAAARQRLQSIADGLIVGASR